MQPTNSKKFLHGIDLSYWYPVWNLPITGTLFSANYLLATHASFKGEKIIEDISLEELSNPSQCLPTVPTNRMLWFYIAQNINYGKSLKYGNFDSKTLNKEETKQLIKKGEVEYIFEQVRREVSPTLASRLGCLFLTDNSKEGRKHINKMFNGDIYIIKVEIVNARKVTRVDTVWFDKYQEEYCRFDSAPLDYIEKYWQGTPYTKGKTWEYLVDGVIRCNDQQDLEYIKNFGKRNFPWLYKNPSDSI